MPRIVFKSDKMRDNTKVKDCLRKKFLIREAEKSKESEQKVLAPLEKEEDKNRGLYDQKNSK